MKETIDCQRFMFTVGLMTVHVRPEIGQCGFQRTLGGDVPLVGPQRLNVTRVDVVVRGTPEETNPSVLKRPDVPIPGVEAKGLVVLSTSSLR